jgi:hypothetical protein
MYDQNNSKFPKKPGAPDFKCKNKECKYQQNRETGEWEPSEYVTGVWVPKAQKAPIKAVSTPNKPIVAPVAHSNESYKTMVMSYCKDVVVALINQKDVDVMAHPFKSIADGYRFLLTTYANPFGKKEEEREPGEDS